MFFFYFTDNQSYLLSLFENQKYHWRGKYYIQFLYMCYKDLLKALKIW